MSSAGVSAIRATWRRAFGPVAMAWLMAIASAAGAKALPEGKEAVEDALHDLLANTKQDVIDWRELRARELAVLYRKLRDDMPEVKVPSVVRLWITKHNPFAGAYSRAYAERIWRQWYLHVWNPLKWVEVWLFDWVNGARFLTHLLVKGR